MPTTYTPFQPGNYRSGSDWEKRVAQSTMKGAPLRGAAGVTPEFGLANQFNQFMSQQASIPFEMNLPGYTSMREQQSGNIGAQLRGEVPMDVRNLISQAGAERGVMGGQAAGSPNANAAWLRALGLTSIGQQQAGQAGLTAAIQQTPYPELWNPAGLYTSERLAQEELEQAQAGAYKAPAGVQRTTYTGTPAYGLYPWGTGRG